MEVKKLGIFSAPLLDRQIGEIVRAFIPEEWIAPTLLNGWVNYGGTLNPAGYYKHLGRVYLRGLLANGSVGNYASFTLPEGYRPPNRELFIVSAYQSTAYVEGRVDVQPNGDVLMLVGGTGFMSLDGISFRVA